MATKRKTRGDSTDTGAQKPAKAAKPAAPARKRKPAGRPAKASAAAPARPMLPALRLPALTDLMPASDAAVRRATGKGWTEWLAVLDTLGARELPHKAIAKLLAVKLGVPAWWSQMVAVGYERALGRRAVNEKSDGFAANVSKTLYTAAEKAFDAWIDPEFRKRWLPELRFINQYHDEPAWIAAMAGSIRAHWQAQGRQDHLLFSFHGIPRRYLLNGDPYHCQCHQSARQVAEALGLARHEWSLSFQSRVGKEEWLRPYTDELLREYGKSGPRRITAVCPGFAVDCLETLEEIAIRNRDDFIAAGGESLDYVPCLNDSPDHVALLADLVARHCRGWPEAEPGYDPATRAEAGAAAAARAIELGAES